MKKKLSVLAITGIILSVNSLYSYANDNLNNYNNMRLSTNYKENLEIHNNFLKLFPEEMNEIEQLGKKKSNQGKSKQELLEETRQMKPFIDTEKEDNNNYYRLVAYSNGVYYKLGVKDGTSTTGTGYVSYKARKAYGQFYAPALNETIGHTFTSVITYTNVSGGYDYIDVANPYSFYKCQNAYTHSRKLKENSSGKAYAKFYYDGRTSYNKDFGDIYNQFIFTVYVGSDTISVSANLR